jgi:hypothetical protein
MFFYDKLGELIEGKNVLMHKSAFLKGRIQDPQEMRKLLNYKSNLDRKRLNDQFEENLE